MIHKEKAFRVPSLARVLPSENEGCLIKSRQHYTYCNNPKYSFRNRSCPFNIKNVKRQLLKPHQKPMNIHSVTTYSSCGRESAETVEAPLRCLSRSLQSFSLASFCLRRESLFNAVSKSLEPGIPGLPRFCLQNTLKTMSSLQMFSKNASPDTYHKAARLCHQIKEPNLNNELATYQFIQHTKPLPQYTKIVRENSKTIVIT